MTNYTLRRDAGVPMSDGVTLRADVWLPGDAPAPVLLQRLPYDKSSSFMSQHIVGLEVLRALDAGFAVVIQDTRGRYASDGDFDPFTHEAADGRDTIAWVREQEFCNGDVFMYGASYIGATQLLAASTAPAGLKGIAPQLTAAEYYENWTYRGGALQLGFVLLWIIESLAGPDLDRRPEAKRDLLAELSKDPGRAMERLPLRDDALLELAPYLRDWLDHPARDAFWENLDPYRESDVAGLHIGGWNDIFIEGTLRNFQRMGGRQHLVVGPWSHGNMSAWQGDGWHGCAADAGAVDLTAVHLEFFGALAEGREPDLPPARIFFTGANEWRDLPSWPPATNESAWLLFETGELLPDAPLMRGARNFRSDPVDPVPTAGGASFLPGLLVARNSGPKDQAAVEAREDVLVFTSAALEEPCTIAGEVVLELAAASTAVCCDWTARLAEVDADGRSVGLVDGILRTGVLTPGRRMSHRVLLGSLAHIVPAGHRLRLQIASSNFPRFDRNPQWAMRPSEATAADFAVADQTVFTGSGNTRLVLPVCRGPVC